MSAAFKVNCHACTYNLTRFELLSHIEQLIGVLAKAQIVQSFRDVLTRNRLLRLFLCNVIRFSRDHSYELYAAFYEQISRLFCECYAL